MSYTYRQPGTVITDRTFAVPLDHADPGGRQIEVFAREVVAAENGGASRPWLVYLQGGPGFGAERPVSRDHWLDRALREYRVLLLDQRGTGRSTPANRLTLAGLGTPGEQADYLAHFRADSIVADAELIRPQVTGGGPWTVLGQSFGGFCTVTYLSRAPEGVARALITGGLPGLDTTADDVYRQTYAVVGARNRAHYQRYPGDVETARRIGRLLAREPVTLPGGMRLTVAGFQSLGLMLGAAAGSAALHYLLEDPFAGEELTDAFRYRVESVLTRAASPLYALLHEACYAQGGATRWAAQRVLPEFPEFDPDKALEGEEPLLFTGEMVYPWMFTDDPVLAPLAEAAQELARREPWPALYDRTVLANSRVPAAAAVYFNDMYVPTAFSVRTASLIGGLRAWVTSEYEHDGLRVSGDRVLDRLLAMTRGEI